MTEQGRQYLAMELVRGLPITQFCDRERLPIRERLKLLIDACYAVEHAHELGIIHRDLKPSNVMVTSHAGTPQVKIIDFGVSKTHSDFQSVGGSYTLATQCIGTPVYMSPEQLRCSSDVDQRTDVYSFGIMLFELITGSPPLVLESERSADSIELWHRLHSEETIWPSQRLARLDPEERKRVCSFRKTQESHLLREVQGDLDWIALKALKLDREQRYTSPAALAADLVAHMEHRSIAARRPSLVLQWSNWGKRHSMAIKVAMAVMLFASAIMGLSQLNQTIRQAQSKQAEAQVAKSQADAERDHMGFVRDIQEAFGQLQSGNNEATTRLLDQYSMEPGQPYAANFAINYLRAQVPAPIELDVGHQQDILDMDVSSDQKWIVSSDRGGDIIIWDRSTGKEVHRLHPSDSEVTRVRFSPDGKLLATAGQDHLIRLWKVGIWTAESSLSGHQLTINGLGWSPDGCKIASGDRSGEVCIWDVESLACVKKLPKHAGAVRCLGWSPDGKYLATANGDPGVSVWDCDSWEQTAFIANNGKGTLSLAFSADSRYLAFGGYYDQLVVFDLLNQSVVQRSKSQSGVWSLTFACRNELLAGLGNGSLQVFQYSTANQVWESTRILG